MAVILLFVLIQTYRFATISSMTIGVAKLAKRDLMILTIHVPANFVINRGLQSGRQTDKHFGKGRFAGNN